MFRIFPSKVINALTREITKVHLNDWEAACSVGYVARWWRVC